MPFKLIGYLLRHAAIGLALSSTAVIGFAYLIMVPGSDLDWTAKMVNATEQLMQISHLLLPLVMLIGLSFGLGLLHNHSEIVLLTQIQQVRMGLALVLLICMTFLVLAERLLWPQFEPAQLSTEQNAWQQTNNTYWQTGIQAIRVSQGHIVGYRSVELALGEELPSITQEFNQTTAITTISWFWPPASTKQQYAWWQQWHQAMWPVPLFLLLWVVLNKRQRGSSAASLTGTIAGAAITAGLLAEALNIVLNKALIAPWLTMVLPFTGVSALTLLLIWRNK